MFCSKDPQYRSPVGAVPDGSPVHFRITLPRDLSCSAARMVMEQEGVGTQLLDMFWCGMNGEDREWWECDFTPAAPGLYFYYFEARTCRGTLRLSRAFGGEAKFGGMHPWQMTVYSQNAATPDWLEGGVMYQIMSDRFASSGEEKENVPAGRTFHEDWYEQPEWRPNAAGRVTNSDFFRGDLKGVRQKLPYLKSLGVTCIYFNPLFESHSNHRYDTADYSRIDPLLGTEQDFTELCSVAKELGIRVIIDGVFNHTGSDSVYFNREGRYPGLGAFNSTESPYYPWFSFKKWPEEYECWWNFDTLPAVNETDPQYREFINGREGIVRRWLKAGASGWRLDVVDELPDPFLDELCAAVKDHDENAVVLGEVWEDASNKAAYGVRRRYLLGGQLDTVMNYPFRDAIIGYLLGNETREFGEIVGNIVENYPPQCLRLLMNHIGTHDTERILTLLGGEPSGGRGREWQSSQRLTPEQRELGKKRLKLASLIQYLLPGVPCLYYGDEAGMEGYRDPFNRACYPWGREDAELVEWYRGLGRLRTEQKDILARGAYRTLLTEGDVLAFERYVVLPDGSRGSLVLAVNRSDQPRRAELADLADGQVLLGGTEPDGALPPFGFLLVRLQKSPQTE